MLPSGGRRTEWALGTKVSAGFGVMIALVLLGSAISLWSVVTLGHALDTAVNRTTRKLEMIAEVKTAATALRNGQRGVILYSMMNQPQRASDAERQFRASSALILTRLEELRPLLVTESGRQSVRQIGSSVTDWSGFFESLVALCRRGDYGEELKRLVDRAFVRAGEIDASADSLAQTQRTLLKQASEEASSATSLARQCAAAVLCLSLLAGFVVQLVMRRATKRLQEIASQLSRGADQVSSAAATVSQTSQSLAQSSTELAASIQETSASTEEVKSMAERNSASANQGITQVAHVTSGIGQAKTALDKMLLSITEINASSTKIAQIIRVIDDIAFQTNILALNAAVEAARAGESGLGFAVVADEVRNLAQRCAQAAKDTASLIEESVSKARQGQTRVDEVAGATTAIEEGAAIVKTLVDEVGAGSLEQTRGLALITKAVTEMQSVTQQTAANSEEGAAASEELAAQASSLHDLAAALQVIVAGTAAAASGHHESLRPPGRPGERRAWVHREESAFSGVSR